MDRHSDVLVIGGGIIGLACAYYLMKEGKRVRLLEQNNIGTGASYGNCGLIFSSHLIPLCEPGIILQEIKRMFRRTSPLYIKFVPDFQRFFWFWKFAKQCNSTHLSHAIQAREMLLRQSKSLFETLFKQENLECDWEEKGVLLVFKTQAEMEKYVKTNDRLKPFGFDAVPYVGDALFKLEPALREDVYGAWYHKTDSHLRPDKLLSAWKHGLEEMGIVIEEDCRLETLVPSNQQIVAAETTKGNYTADDYVLTIGAWTPQITKQLKLNIPIQPGKGYSITMARPTVCPKIPCYFYERSVVATPWKSGFRLGGTMEFSGLNSRIISTRIQNLKSVAGEYLKEPFHEPVIEEWVGMRPMLYDDLPIIDRTSNPRNLIVATGHGMAGISMATGTGKLVAEIIAGQEPHIDPSAFSIKRFH
jgi:D-amino-acid dehydrogenase